METDINGCSQCQKGQEQIEHFTAFNKQRLIQYDYRDDRGNLFSTIAKTVEIARRRRDAWARDNKEN